MTLRGDAGHSDNGLVVVAVASGEAVSHGRLDVVEDRQDTLLDGFYAQLPPKAVVRTREQQIHRP